MNEHVMQKRWTRATQMIFMAAMLSGSAACNTISGADSINFTEPDAHGSSAGAGSGTDSTPPMETKEQIRCEANYVMVGVEGRYGSWVDSVGVTCAELTVGGNLGTMHHILMEVGGLPVADQKPYHADCASGQVVGALHYKHAKEHLIYIQRVSVGCATVSDWKNSGQVFYSEYDGVNAPQTVDEMPVSLNCDPGEIADGVDVLVGEDEMSTHVRSFGPLHCIKAPGS